MVLELPERVERAVEEDACERGGGAAGADAPRARTGDGGRDHHGRHVRRRALEDEIVEEEILGT